MKAQTDPMFEITRTGNKSRKTARPGPAGASAVVALHKTSFNSRPFFLLCGPRKERCYDRNPAGGGSRQTS